MKQLIYASHAKPNITVETVNELVAYSKETNRVLGVTGFLIFNNQFFLQCLEGEAEAIEAQMYKIKEDTRHTNIKVLGSKRIIRKTFDSLAMGFINNENTLKEIITRDTNKDTFNPHHFTYDEALHVLLSLSKVM